MKKILKIMIFLKIKNSIYHQNKSNYSKFKITVKFCNKKIKKLNIILLN